MAIISMLLISAAVGAVSILTARFGLALTLSVAGSANRRRLAR